MKKTLITITIIILLVIVGILFWKVIDLEQKVRDNIQNADTNVILNTQNNNTNTNAQQNINYKGEWYLTRESYVNEELIDEVLDGREDNLITDEEFNKQMQSEINSEVAILEIEQYINNRIVFDFELTSPAPTRREGKIENISVDIENNVGEFDYIDNWGTKGSGTIKLEDGNISLELKTTEASSGALWGVEGNYLFTYKVHD